MALPAFLGVLESPLDTGKPRAGESVSLRGWAMHADDAIDGIAVTASWLAQPVPLSIGLRRADVAAAFPEWHRAAVSGFAGELALPLDITSDEWLRVEVFLGGRLVHTWERRWQRESVDAAWQRWRSTGIESPASAVTPPAITWLISPRGAGGGAATSHDLTAWQAFGGPGSRALPIDSAATVPAMTTPWFGLVQSGDRPHATSLGWLAQALAGQPDLVIGDHDHRDGPGNAIDPVLKPGWHRMLADHPDVGGRAWLLGARHWPLPAADARQRMCEAPPMHHWLAAWANSPAANQARVAQLRLPLLSAPQEPVARAVPARSTNALSTASHGTPSVAVVIPTCLADPDLLGQALDGLFASEDAQRLEVVVVLNNLRGHTVEEARARLRRWPVHGLHMEGVFNWSAFNNAGARATRAPHLLFLNDDITTTDTQWLSAMQASLASPGVGAVGAVLRYPDGRLQHAGIQVHGEPELMCRHLFRFCRGDEPRVGRWLNHDLPVSAVTGACLLTPREVFERAGGFDEQLPLVYNDVDYGLRLRESGLTSVVCSRAMLCHHEGWSRGGLAEDADRDRFVQRWQGRWPAHDPHGHPWLTIERDDWMPDFDRAPEPVIELRDA